MSTSPDVTGKLSSSNAEDVVRSGIFLSGQAAERLSYPPTEVRRWLICPVFRDYSRRWVSRVEPWTPHKSVGTAIHAGVAHALRSHMAGTPTPDATASVQVAYDMLKVEYVQQETWGYEGLEALVRKGTARLISEITTHLLPGAKCRGVEMADQGVFPPGVSVRRMVDCILERDGKLEVWDWKTHMNQDERYIPDKAREVAHQWQLLDYAWHAQQWFQMSVARVGHGRLTLGPKMRVDFQSVAVTQERLDQWQQDAQVIWHRMSTADSYDTGRAQDVAKRRVAVPTRAPSSAPWHNWEACSDRHLHYGKECVFFAACHELCGDETRFGGCYRPMEETL